MNIRIVIKGFTMSLVVKSIGIRGEYYILEFAKHQEVHLRFGDVSQIYIDNL